MKTIDLRVLEASNHEEDCQLWVEGVCVGTGRAPRGGAACWMENAMRGFRLWNGEPFMVRVTREAELVPGQAAFDAQHSTMAVWL